MNLAELSLPRSGPSVRLEERDGTVYVIRATAETAVGSVELSRTANGDITVERVCIAERERGRGAGTEAANILTTAAREAGARRLFAWAPPGNGLAVYYWIRCGFRPLFGARDGGGSRFLVEFE